MVQNRDDWAAPMSSSVRVLISLLGCLCIVTLCACNTTKGAGEDLERAGQGIQKSAERHGAN